jgi:PAS domain S-box-containing protein
MNILQRIDIVYTHLFYIPIILAGIWYKRKAVYVALLFGIVHIIFNYMADGAFTYDALLRAAMFLIIAYIVGWISLKKDTLFNILKSSEEKLRLAQETLESRVRERTAELSRMNESLKVEIAEREHAEKALRESEEKFKVLTEASPAVTMLYQCDKLIYVNRATEMITGYSRDELLSGEPWHFVHPSNRDEAKSHTESCLHGKPDPSRYEVRILTKGGEDKWLDISTELITYGDVPTGLISGIDISKRKKMEKALIKSQAILSRAQSIAHVGNWALDIEKNEVQWSDEIYRIVGLSPGSPPPAYDWLISHTHPDDRDKVTNTLTAAIKENKLFNIDYRIITADGSVRYINSVADKLRKDPADRPIWLYGIIQDITARKQVEEALQESKAQAELYLDLMGHDINNLNQIGMGFLELALDTLDLDEKARQLISKPLEAIGNSTRLISNVRKLQRARGDTLVLNAVDVEETIRRLIPQYSKVAGRDIAIDFKADGACRVMANDLLTDVFSNIIGNAIKHSSGPLTIGIDLKNAMVDDKQYCIIGIEDNGPGIHDDVKQRLFASRAGGSMRAGAAGSGFIWSGCSLKISMGKLKWKTVSSGNLQRDVVSSLLYHRHSRRKTPGKRTVPSCA